MATRLLVCGEDTHRSRRHLRQLRDKFAADRDPTGLNLSVFRHGDFDAALEAIFASPFLAERKLVIIEDFLSKLAVDRQRRLLESLERQPDSTVIVAYEPVGALELKKSPLLQPLLAEAHSVEFKRLNAAEAVAFAARLAADGGCEIERPAALLLSELTENDSWRLSGEIAKLVALTSGSGRSRITRADVESVTSGAPLSSIFDFIDACTAGSGSAAMTSLDRLIAGGMAEMQIIAMLQKHFRTLVGAHDLLSGGEVNESQAASRLAVHPFVAKKSLQAARRFSGDFLRDRYRDLVDIERKFKTGQAKPRLLLDVFAARLAAACATRR